MDDGSANTSDRTTVTQRAHELEQALAAIDPAPFSQKGFAALNQSVAAYISSIIDESIKMAKRHRADTVSEAHVDLASDYLVSSEAGRIVRNVGTIGGILLGAAISNVLNMVTARTFTPFGVSSTIVIGIVGAFMVAVHFVRQ